MPRGGHNRLTVEQHRLRGTFRADRHASGLAPVTSPAPGQTSPARRSRPAVPRHLTGAARRWFIEMAQTWDFSAPHHRRLLIQAAECVARLDAARATLAREGAIIRDRFGAPKEHPAAVQERATAQLFAALIRDLKLEE